MARRMPLGLGSNPLDPPENPREPLLVPIMPSVRVAIDVTRTRTGTIKKMAYDVAPAPDGTTFVMPGAGNTMVKGLLAAGLKTDDIHVRWARGYDLNAKGENVRAPIWETVPGKQGNEDEQQPVRRKAGEHPPVPVNSVVVFGAWRLETLGALSTRLRRALVVTWIDRKAISAFDWTPGGAVALSITDMAALVASLKRKD